MNKISKIKSKLSNKIQNKNQVMAKRVSLKLTKMWTIQIHNVNQNIQFRITYKINKTKKKYIAEK